MKRRTHRHHQFDPLGYGGKRSRGRPGAEGRRFHSLDVIQIQFSDQREIKTSLLTPLRQLLHIRPAGLHVLVFNVAQPTTKNGKPISKSHRRAPLAIVFSSPPASWTRASWRMAS